jgi:hypothetical protein
MSVNAPHGAGSSRDSRTALFRVPRAGKSGETGTSARRQSSDYGQFGRRRYDGTDAASSRFGTGRGVSEWHAAGPEAAFAAQVIGQALHTQTPQRPRTAYRQAIPPALFLDKSV